jgi:hypothetical protein
MATFKTQLRLGQITGSFGDAPGKIIDTRPTGASTLAGIATHSGSLVGVLSEIASSVKRITGASTFASNTAGQFDQDLVIAGSTPRLTIGDGTAEDTSLVFDGNAQDYYVALDDGTDKLMIGLGSAVGTTPAIEVDSSQNVLVVNDLEVGDDVKLGSDASILSFGGDGEVSLTHVHDTGLLLNSTREIQFADANSKISNPGAGLKLEDHAVIEVEAATSVQLDSPIVDFEDDGVVLQFGADDDVTLTHIHDGGLQLNANKGLSFGGGTSEVISGDGNDLTVATGRDIVVTAVNMLKIDAQGTDSGDGLELTLGSDTADTMFKVRNNSGASQLEVRGDGSAQLAGNLTVNGNLDVNGATTTIDTVNLTVQDSIIALGVSGSGAYSTSGDRAILFPRGAASSLVHGLSFNGTRFSLGASATSPASGSVASIGAADFSTLRLGAIEAGSDSAYDIGASGTAFRKLFVDDIDLDGQGRIALDADGDTSIRSSGDDIISFELGGADIVNMSANGLQIVDDKGLAFGNGSDATFKYDEAVSDTLLYAGASLRFSDDTKLEFGAAGDASIEYDEDGTDQLRFVLPADGMVLGGATPKLVIGDADAEDTLLVFDGNAQDYRIGLDDGTDTLEFGVGATHGTTPSMALDSSRNVDIVAHDGTNGLFLGGTVVSALASELSLLDGDVAVGSSITLADGDGFIVDDGGTTKKIPASDLKSYISAAAAGLKNVTVVSAAVAANANFATGVAGIEAAAESRVEVYVNGQLLARGADASANMDFYPGDASGQLKFEFDLEVDDVVTAILRAS